MTTKPVKVDLTPEQARSLVDAIRGPISGTFNPDGVLRCGCTVLNRAVEFCPLHDAAEAMRGILEAIVYSPVMVENDEPLMNEARALLAKVTA